MACLVCSGRNSLSRAESRRGKNEDFSTQRDYKAFEEAIEEMLRLYPMRILAHCLLPNHWHFILWPKNDGDLSAFLQRLTDTHTPCATAGLSSSAKGSDGVDSFVAA